MADKVEILILRVKSEDKTKIASAARKQGQSITNFITYIALKEANKILRKEREMGKTIERPVHGGIPTFFRALCLTASQGGSHSYKDAGYSFGIATEGEMLYDAGTDEWQKMLQEVSKYIENENRDGIWRWYKKVYPKAMTLVPNNRKSNFIDGILEAYNDGKLWFL